MQYINFMKNNFLSGRQNNPIFWQNEQKVLPPITKSIRHVQYYATDELCYPLACNLYQNEEEGLDVPEHTGYSLFEDPELSGPSLIECPAHSGKPDNVIGVP